MKKLLHDRPTSRDMLRAKMTRYAHAFERRHYIPHVALKVKYPNAFIHSAQRCGTKSLVVFEATLRIFQEIMDRYPPLLRARGSKLSLSIFATSAIRFKNPYPMYSLQKDCILVCNSMLQRGETTAKFVLSSLSLSLSL